MHTRPEQTPEPQTRPALGHCCAPGLTGRGPD